RPSKADNVHAYFRLRLVSAADPDARLIGLNLEWLQERRTKADYDLLAPQFANDTVTREAVAKAEQALVLLEAIDADPARGAPVHVFAAVMGRDDLIGRRLQDVAEKLCGGSLTPLLTHLVRQRRLSDRERQELRELIDGLERGGQPGEAP